MIRGEPSVRSSVLLERGTDLRGSGGDTFVGYVGLAKVGFEATIEAIKPVGG